MNRPLLGTTRVVPDKSITHRGVLLSALARGQSVLLDPNPGADCAATLRAVESLGVTVRREPDRWILAGGSLCEPADVLDLGNSGTGLRLLTGLLCAHPLFAVLTGDRSLRSRPMERIIRPLVAMGARIDARGGSRAPLAVRGGPLQGIDFENVTGSAQVKSALLLAGLGLRSGGVVVREALPSRDHTERMLAWMGAPLSVSPVHGPDATAPDALDLDAARTITLRSGSALAGREWRVPGDISAALFLLVAAAITPGSRITVEGVGLNPTRTGAISALQRMGAQIAIHPDPPEGPEPVGSIEIAHGPLQCVEVGGAEVPRLIDEIPVLAIAAACASGLSRFTGVGELRVKESDRLRTTCDMLRALGVTVEERENEFCVHGGGLRGGRVESHDDHRIAMSALVAGCAAEGEVTVDSVAMVDTSDPGFHRRLARLRGEQR